MKNNNEMAVKNGIFKLGNKNEAFAKYFIGQSYLENLVNDPDINVNVSNVSFEPGCRNNWHKHQDGYQLLLATGGEGWYQEEGTPARKLHPGDVVIVHNNVKHWHGATKNSWFSHIAITTGTPVWLDEVSDTEYNKLEG